jgi:membrane-bound lytic murein transglycosylase D
VLAPVVAPDIAGASTPPPAVAAVGGDVPELVQTPPPPVTATATATATVERRLLRTHTVSRGESVWTIARRYKLQVADLLSRNALAPRAILRPGMVLRLDGDVAE